MAGQRDYADEDTGMFVVVTIAPNGIVHAWGEGPVVDTEEVVAPFAFRVDARRAAARIRREDREQHPGAQPMVVKVCKVMGVEPVEVKA